MADLRAGITAALTALPVELVYGLFAVAPLGPQFVDAGLRAALTGCILVTLLGLLFGGNRLMIGGSRPTSGLILGTLAALVLQHPTVASFADPAEFAFLLVLACTLLAGGFQWLFGTLGFGRVLKYVPFPVTGGLMLGVGVLMILSSLRPALGVDRMLPWTSVLSDVHPASLLVTLTSLAACVVLPRIRSPLPGSAVALFLGTAMHHMLAAWLGPAHLGPTAAGLFGALPDLTLWNLGSRSGDLVEWLPVIASYALTIAALGSIETLLCLTRITTATGARADADLELRAQGRANLISGLCGGTVCVGNLSRVNVVLGSGGTGPLAGIAYALALLLIMYAAGPLLSLVPDAVTAGIILYFAAGMVDQGTRHVLKQLVVLRREREDEHYRQLMANVTVIALVAMVTVFGDLMKAVGVGIAAAMFLFVTTSMKPVVRRIAFGDRLHSMKIRASEDGAVLATLGREILILEVDGPLFFGTADRLAEEVGFQSRLAHTVILDLSRVPDIDSTGARTLIAAAAQLAFHQCPCLFAGTPPSLDRFLDVMGLSQYVPATQRYHDLDHALQAAEDALLSRHGGHTRHRELDLAETELTAGLNEDEIASLAVHLRMHHYTGETELFRLGDPGDSLFVASSASVDILLPLPDGKHKRLVSLAPGICFGEMALLEQRPRSTSARLLGASRVWELQRSVLDELLIQHPRIAGQILKNIGQRLAHRLRDVTSTLSNDH